MHVEKRHALETDPNADLAGTSKVLMEQIERLKHKHHYGKLKPLWKRSTAKAFYIHLANKYPCKESILCSMQGRRGSNQLNRVNADQKT